MLATLHAELDAAIIGRRGASLGDLTLSYAKQVKCAIKTELAKRALLDDPEAQDYAAQRRWDQKVKKPLSIAAE